MEYLNISCHNIKRLIDAIMGLVKLYNTSIIPKYKSTMFFHLTVRKWKSGMGYYCLINIHYMESRIHLADCFSWNTLPLFGR